jgi:hypothetical protein
MDNPGIFGLFNTDGEDFTISAAGTQMGDVVEDLEGIRSLALHARFAYGSGGTTCKVYVQTSLDQGTTWFDVACFAFTTAGLTRVMNLSAMTPVTTPQAPADGGLADNTALDGPLGDRFRAKVVSVGTYAGPTVLSLRGCAR